MRNLYLLLLPFIFLCCTTPEEEPQEVQVVDLPPVDDVTADYQVLTGQGMTFVQLGTRADSLPANGQNISFVRDTITTTGDEPEQRNIFRVMQKGKEVAKLFLNRDERVDEIHVLSKNFRTEEGIGVQTDYGTFFDKYPQHQIWYTYVSDRLIGETNLHPHLQFVFENTLNIDSLGLRNNPKAPVQSAWMPDSVQVQAIRVY